jgi:glycosyltransferase involved in cell wall biosynthesis
MTRASRGEILVVSQVYPPDPASVGQHLADLSSGMSSRGFSVNVLTADRGYDDPKQKYPRTGTVAGAKVRRLRFSSFGKRSMPIRALGAILFSLSAAVRGTFLRKVDAIVITTAPPLGVLTGLWLARIRRAALVYWVMDLNPDQAVSLGLTPHDSLVARLLRGVNGMAFRRADLLVVLDHFMERRVRQEYGVERPMLVMPPWPHDQFLGPTDHSSNRFRTEGGVREGQLVFMYAGNHAESAPVTTFLRAAEALSDDDRVCFFFVGGGRKKPDVEEFVGSRGLSNVRCLPYQPLEDLGELLGAADVHMVTMGEQLVGINHPCKVYGAMGAARPILYVGPSPSHISDLIDEHEIGWHVNPGDVGRAVRVIRRVLEQPKSDLHERGARAQRVANTTYSRENLVARLVDQIEGLL